MEPDNITKIFCIKCSQPILVADDKIEIEGRHFHKNCSICSVCHITPTSLQMYYGQIVCDDCFKKNPGFVCDDHGNQYPGWWLHWNPYMQSSCSRCNNCGVNANVGENNLNKGSNSSNNLLCFRCHQIIGENCKVLIDGKHYHDQCVKCCVCNLVPTSMKIYYGQVFCDICLQQHVYRREGPSQFFQSCFEQWRENPRFGDFMNRFMTSGSNNHPVFVMQHGPTPFWGCRSSHQWNSSERGKSGTTTDSQAFPETESSFITINANETFELTNRKETNNNDDASSNVTFTERDESIDDNISEHTESNHTSVAEHLGSTESNNHLSMEGKSVNEFNKSLDESIVVEHDLATEITNKNVSSSDSTITEDQEKTLHNVEEINKNKGVVETATSEILEKIEKLSRLMRVRSKISCNKKWKIFVRKEELLTM